MNKDSTRYERSQAENNGGFAPPLDCDGSQDVLSQKSTECICAWPTSFSSVRQTHTALEKVLGSLSDWVVRVDAVQHKSFPVRLDISVTSEHAELVLAALHKHRRRLGLRVVKRHVPFQVRERRRGLPPDWWAGLKSGESGYLAIATLNLHGGLTKKKTELATWSGARQVGALLLQETNRPHWGGPSQAAVPGFDGNDVALTPHEAGARGTGAWTRRGMESRPLLASTLEKQPAYKGMAFRRIRLPRTYNNNNNNKDSNDNKWLIVGSIYMAQGVYSRKIKVAVKRTVTRLLMKYPDDVMVLGGDFNMPPDRLDKMLAQWGVPMTRIRLDGSSLTFHSSRVMSSLDHFVMTTRDLHLVSSAAVDRTWDNSDHWPVVLRLKIPTQRGEDRAKQSKTQTHTDSDGWVTRAQSAPSIAEQEENRMGKSKLQLKRSLLPSKRDLVVGSNRFAVLAASFDGATADGISSTMTTTMNKTTDDLTDDFIRQCRTVAEEAELVTSSREGTRAGMKLHFALDMETRRLISERHTIARRLSQEVGKYLLVGGALEGAQHAALVTSVGIERTERFKELNRQYRDASKAVNRRLDQSKKAAWNKYIANGAGFMAQNDSKRAWRWAQNHLVDPEGGRTRSMLPHTIHPVYQYQQQQSSSIGGSGLNSNGSGLNNGSGSSGAAVTAVGTTATKRKLCTEPGEIVSEWASYYSAMLSDATGHSKAGNAYWDAVATKMEVSSEPLLENNEINGEITWREVNDVLRSFSGSKAAGLSGLTPDWYKLAQEDPREVVPLPQTALGAVLLGFCQRVFSSAYIPIRLRAAEVVNIHKGGDACDMNNYRGISLIEIPLKVVCAVVTRRVSESLEKAGRLSIYQAGFRRSEEAMGHVVSLHEMVQRRVNRGKTTYLAFIDVKKAFDSVPHGALLKKLELIGVHGGCHRFFAALYESSVVQVRCGGGYTTAPIAVERGVRQGCPASPLLFNIFINDILSKCQALGVDCLSHPGQAVEGLGQGTNHSTRVPGLLFADDLVLICPSKGKLRRALESITAWAEAWELQFNASKCGIMGVGRNGKSTLGTEWRLQGVVVPVVQKYKYLGIWFSEEWSYGVMLEHHERRVQKSLDMSLGFLRNASIPTALRLLILKGQVLPIANYGGELFGMSADRAARTQTLVNSAVRGVIGAGARSHVGSVLTLMLELGIKSTHASWSAQRARLYVKLNNVSRTVARDIMASKTMVSSKGTWASISRKWLKVHGPPVSDFDEPGTAIGTNGLPIVAPKLMGLKVRKHLMRKLLNTSSHIVSLTRYNERGYIDTNGFIKRALKYPGLAKGITQLIRFRTGWGKTALRWAQMNVGPAEWRDRCPFCKKQGSPEDAEHLFLGCSRWKRQRKASGLRQVSRAVVSYWRDANSDSISAYTIHDEARETLTILLGGKSTTTTQSLGAAWLSEGCDDDLALQALSGMAAADALVDPTNLSGQVDVVSDEVSSARGPKLPCYAVVAGFLMSVEESRRGLFFAHQPDHEPKPPGAGQPLMNVLDG